MFVIMVCTVSNQWDLILYALYIYIPIHLLTIIYAEITMTKFSVLKHVLSNR